MATVVHDRELALQAVSPRIVANDSVLTPPEKPIAIQNYNTIIAEQPALDADAVAYGITTEKTTYDNAVSALTTYLGTLTGWNVIPGTNVPIVGSTYRQKWQDVYVAKSALQSAINNAINGDLNNVAPTSAPNPPTNFQAVSEPFGIRLSITGSTSQFVTSYEYRLGTVWESGTVIESAGGTSVLWKVQATGTYNFMVKAKNTANQQSTVVTASVTLSTASISGFGNAITGTDFYLQWTGTAGSFAISGYEIRQGTAWATASVVDFRQVNTYRTRVDWLGNRTYWVAGIDVNGNYGTPVSTVVTVNGPSSITGQRAEVVDNNVLLYWTASVIGGNQLPITYYNVKKGADYASGTTVGSNGNSTFTTVFEQQAGTYNYWIAPVDSAGNIGTAIGVTATVNQPPDYVLRYNYDSTFDGADPPSLAVTNTATNFYLENGKLIGPVNTSQTWSTHFSGNSWTTPQNQVDAGYPLYIQPGLSTGSYEEILDYGTTIPPTVATVTLTTTTISGSMTSAQITLSHKVNLGDSWTTLTAGTTTALLPTFRYLRIQFNVSCTAGANLVRIDSLNVKLAVKLRTDSGSATVTDTTNGKAVTFGISPGFISADTPVVQPEGSTPLIPVVIYSGGANPTGFTVKLYTRDTGVSTTGSFSWTARGF